VIARNWPYPFGLLIFSRPAALLLVAVATATTSSSRLADTRKSLATRLECIFEMGFAIVIALIFLMVLIIGHEFGHFVAAKLLGATVEEFGLGFPPRLASKRIGETEYSVNAIPFGGFVRIHGENGTEEELGRGTNDKTGKHSFRDFSATRKIITLAAGIFMNLLIGWLAISAVFMIGIPSGVVISEVAPNSPAAAAGLAPGDQITSFGTPEAFTSYIAVNTGKEIRLKISRDGNEQDITATPRISPPVGEGRLGVAVAESGIPKENFLKALSDGAKLTVNSAASIFLAIAGIIKGALVGQFGGLSNITGPVGLFSTVGAAAKMGVVYLFELLGLISVSLAVVNALPFPALDGGRIFVVLGEKLFRRPLSRRLEAAVNTVGLIFLLFLMLLITIRDISHI